MKIKMYVVDLEIPRRVKRWALLVGVPLGILFGVVAIAYASITTFKSGDPLSSATMNANFSDLDKRLTSLEGILDAGTPDSGVTLPIGAIVWKDTKGAIMPVVRPLGDGTNYSVLAPPNGEFEIFDATSKAVWIFGLWSPVVVQPTTTGLALPADYTLAGCTGTEYVDRPPPSRYAFASAQHAGNYYVLPDGVSTQPKTILSWNTGTGCTTFSSAISVEVVPFSSVTMVTKPTAAPGVPPYHPEPL